ncbi:hypothetical protein G7Y89_g6826 [Cudoniella acicularis]|uniref:Zn(2)-C6 fungal-type domain-containing protein n=1 Tax=Cudoniella acicularis TaxID=354080 RepID=A0A8H4RN55_9HELO|nr:hypothetical protein G7Y89_g6826 [Cudoniella acicularis]
MTLPESDSRREAAKRSGPSGSRGNGQRLTRRRIPLSCVACRVRKLKCNREKPCQNCIVRGEVNAASCTYAEKVEKKGSGPVNPRSDAEDMRKRLNRLESSILSMMETNSSQSSESPAANSSSSGSQMESCPSQTGGQKISVDTRSTHWDTILNELGAMKDAWSEENDKIEFSSGSPTSTTKPYRPSLLSGLAQPPDRATVLESLPSRDAADKLVTRFFDSYNPSIPARFLLHKATFLKQLDRHWSNPANTKIIWIGLLYAVLCFAMQSYNRNNDVPPEYEGTAPAIADLYRIRTAQCIVIADITKPGEYMIETLTLYAMCEYTSERDGDMGTWLLSGTMVRLALQQGYHRDPSQHPNLTVFQAEMRRRVWSCVTQHELLFSVLIGLPKFLLFAYCDTRSPSNIHEDELYEDMKEMPPSRPLGEATQVTYQVVKLRIMRAYGCVVEFLHLLQPQPYEEALRLDLMLMQAREEIPAHLQLGTLEEMKNDSPSFIMEKCILQIFYHKAICVLHRKFWDAAPTNTPKGTFYYSRKTCVSSALSLLQHQAMMHRGCRPGGPLVRMKWYNFAITNHDFLLAAMIICLDVMGMRRMANTDITECLVITESEKLAAIRQSQEVWADIVDECQDAKRAVGILDTVLAKLAVKREASRPLETVPPVPPISASALNPNADSLQFSPYFTDQFGLGMPLIGAAPDGNDVVMQETFLDTIGSDLSVPGDFNWDAWDQLMQPQSLTQPTSYDYPQSGMPMY